MTALTDKELILIRETERLVNEDRYGGVWEYIPLAKIRNIGIGKTLDDLLTFSIDLPNDQRIQTLYLQKMQPELLTLIKLFQQKANIIKAIK